MKPLKISPLAVALLTSWAVWITSTAIVGGLKPFPNQITYQEREPNNKHPSLESQTTPTSIGDFIGAGSAILTAFATIAIAGFTLALKRATDNLWSSTQLQLRHMEETAETQLRAYLAAIPFYLYRFNINERLKIKYSITNHGQTPAYQMGNSARIEIFPYPLPEKWAFPPLNPPRASRGTIPPNGAALSEPTAPTVYTEEEIRRILAGDGIRIYIYGIVIYRDVFKKDRTTRFCFSITPNANLVAVSEGTLVDQISFEASSQHSETD